MQNLTTGDGDALPPAMGGLLPLKREEQRSHNQDLAASGALGEFALRMQALGRQARAKPILAMKTFLCPVT